MKKWLKRVGISFGVLFLLIISFGAFMNYKITKGLPIFESTPPTLPTTMGEKSILIFSKTNGYRHKDGIVGAQKALDTMAAKNGWFIVHTKNGAIFNPAQLSLFDVVIWNNVTGQVLKAEQRKAFQTYIENGGGYLGIHGAGDFSHPWDWYKEELIGAQFSHHTITPQFQEATMNLECDSSHSFCNSMTTSWLHTEEWYMFSNNPREKGFDVLYTVDESTIQPSGNIKFLVKDKNWGMGADHPIVWYKKVGEGRTFYSALGHSAAAFEDENHLKLLEGGIKWVGQFER